MLMYKVILISLNALWAFTLLIATNKDSYKATIPAIILQIATIIYLIIE